MTVPFVPRPIPAPVRPRPQRRVPVGRTRFCAKCEKHERWYLFVGWRHVSEVDQVLCEVEW